MGSFQAPWYFVWISGVAILAVLLASKRALRLGIDRKLTIDTLLVSLIGGLVGSRLLHVFFEEPQHYFSHPVRVFDLVHGGFVWYGGLLLGMASAWLHLRWRRSPVLPWFDAMAPLAALSYGVGRIACWIQGCCYGVCLLSSDTDPHCPSGRFPTQLFAVAWELGAASLLWYLSRRPDSLGVLKPARAGQVTGLWLALHGLGRLVMEAFRADPRGELIAGITLGSWMSLCLIILGGLLLSPFSARANTPKQ